MADGGNFIINDIELTIPPQQIKIDHQSFNHRWQTLRTRGSKKVKSGYSIVNIRVRATFVDHSDFEKLRKLVAQLRVTPFAYVENQHIRNAVLEGSQEENLVLALKSINIRKPARTVNSINVVFDFAWFNYKPYTLLWQYRVDIFSNLATNDPKYSYAWKMMYEAEIKKGGYIPIKPPGASGEELSDSLMIGFREFISPLMEGDDSKSITPEDAIKKYFELQGKIKSQAEKSLRGHGASEFPQPVETTGDYVAEAKNLLGYSTSMELDLFSEIQGEIGGKKFTYKGLDWEPLYKDDKPLTKDGRAIFSRRTALDAKRSDITVTGVDISFQHNLAMMPVLGYSHATFQHTGSVDSVVSLQMIARSEEAVKRITHFYNAVKNAEIKYKSIPAGSRNLYVSNDILNLCGIQECIVEQFFIDTIPGQIGTYSISLVLSENSYPDLGEKFVSEFAFSSKWLRSEIAKILEGYVKLAPGFKEKYVFGKKFSTRRVESFENRVYETTILSSDESKKKLYDATKQYAELMSGLYNELEELLGEGKGVLGEYGDSALGYQLASFLSLRDEGVFPGIHKIQSDLMDNVVLNKTKNASRAGKENTGISDTLGALGGDYDAVTRPSATGATEGSFGNALNSLGQKSAQIHALYRGSSGEFTDEERRQKDALTQEYEWALNVLRRSSREYVSNRHLESKEEYQRLLSQYKNNEDVISQGLSGAALKAYWEEFRTVSARRLAEKRLGQRGLQDLIFDIVRDYMGQYVSLLDRLINPGEILKEREFLDIAKQVKESLLKNVGSECYPDFPLREVAEALQVEKGDINYELGELLFSEWKDKGDYMKGLSPACLINPDFYLISETFDKAGNLVDEASIKKVKEISKSSLSNYEQAHKKWLGRVEENYQKRTQAMNSYSRNSFQSLTKKDKERVNKGKASAFGGEAVRSYMKQQSDYMDPYDFPEGGYAYDTPTALALEGANPVEFSTIDAGVDVALGQEDMNDYWMCYGRESVYLEEPEVKKEERIRHIYGGYEILDGTKPSVWGKREDIRAGSQGAPDKWIWPVPSFGRGPNNISSYYGERWDPVEEEKGEYVKAFHYGIDIVNGISGKSSRGATVVAAAPGRVVFAKGGRERKRNVDNEYVEGDKGETSQILIQHGGGFYTRYKHVTGYEKWLDPNSPSYFRKKPFVKGGEEIAKVGNEGYSTGAHLHFETLAGGKETKSYAKDPLLVLAGDYNVSAPITVGENAEAEDLLARFIGEFERDLYLGQGKGVMRAYPTFKLYFIESDFGERKEYSFDDFFSYSSVKNIQLVKHKHIPADVCILELTNISGVLSNRKFRNALDDQTDRIVSQVRPISKEDAKSPERTNTKEENPLVSMLLQAGVQVQLRLGYNNNPQFLETPFNGVITEVQFTESDDLVRVVAQSYGTQLVQRFKGIDKSIKRGGLFSTSGDTGSLLEELLGSTEVTHFGRWEPGSKGQDELYNTLTNRWEFNPKPHALNIFAPGGDFFFNLFKSAPNYYMFRTTIWDVAQEMTLRHPGYICQAVPYEGEWGPRMTLYFGLPNQLYYSRDPNPQEKEFASVLGSLAEKIEKNKELDDSGEQLAKTLKDSASSINPEKFNEQVEKTARDNYSKKSRSQHFDKLKKIFARSTGLNKPFRAYHLVTSESHIIANNIWPVAPRRLYNAVNLQYSDDTIFFDEVEDGKTGKLESSDPEVLSMKADVDIPDEDIREFFARYPNCIGEEQAKRYALGLLWEAQKKAYQGNLIVIGNPRIKPYDVVIIADSYTDMYGMVEVEQVVHKFSQENGFVTEIKPNMLIHVNQTATMTTDEVMGMVAAEVLGKLDMDTASRLLTQGVQLSREADKSVSGKIAKAITDNSEAVALSTMAISMPAGLAIHSCLWLFRKFMAHSQFNHPFRYEPLIYRGQPMLQGLKARYSQKGFFWLKGEFIEEGLEGLKNKYENLKEQFAPENWFDTRGDFGDYFWGIKQGYAGPKLGE